MHNLKINTPPNSLTGIKRHLKTSAAQSPSKKAYQNEPNKLPNTETLSYTFTGGDRHLFAVIQDTSDHIPSNCKILSKYMEIFQEEFETFCKQGWSKVNMLSIADMYLELTQEFDKQHKLNELTKTPFLSKINIRLQVLGTYLRNKLSINLGYKNSKIKHITKNWGALKKSLSDKKNHPFSDEIERLWFHHYAHFNELIQKPLLFSEDMRAFIKEGSTLKQALLQREAVKVLLQPRYIENPKLAVMLDEISVMSLELMKQSKEFPNYQDFKNSTWKSPLFDEFTGEYASLCHRFIKNTILKNHSELNFDIGDDYSKESNLAPINIPIPFAGLDKLLPNAAPYILSIKLEGSGLSVKRFYAQMVLMQFSTLFADHDNMTSQQKKAADKFFNTALQQQGWTNSSGELINIENWDDMTLRNIIQRSIEHATNTKQPADLAKDINTTPFIRGARLYEEQCDYLSGLRQHDAIATYLACLNPSKMGLEPKLFKTVKQSVSNTLQLSLESALISKESDTTLKATKYTALANTVLHYCKNHPEGLCIPSGFSTEESSKKHALYCHFMVDPNGLCHFKLINGGQGVTDDQRYKALQEYETPFCHILQSKDFHIENDTDFLVTYITTLLESPYTPISNINTLFPTELETKNTDHIMPEQRMGSCAIHNFKYALKEQFNMNETELGMLVSTTLLGIGDIIQKLKANRPTSEPVLINAYSCLSDISDSEGKKGLTRKEVEEANIFTKHFIDKHYASNPKQAKEKAKFYGGKVTVIKIPSTSNLKEIKLQIAKKEKSIKVTTAWEFKDYGSINEREKNYQNLNVVVEYEGDKICHMDGISNT